MVDENDSEAVKLIKEILDSKVRPVIILNKRWSKKTEEISNSLDLMRSQGF